jgi:hypothetical protein
VEATAYSTSLHTNFQTAPTARANLQIRVDAEPNHPVIGLLMPVMGVTAKDQNGAGIAFQNPPNQQRYLQVFANQSRIHLSISLDPPDEGVTSLKEFAIPLDVVVPERMVESVVLDPLVSAPNAPGVGPLALRIEAILRHNDFSELKISHATLRAEGPDLLRIQPTYERFEIKDQRGVVLKSEPAEVAQEDNGRMRRSFRLPLEAQIGSVGVRMMSRYRIVQWTASLPDLPIK